MSITNNFFNFRDNKNPKYLFQALLLIIKQRRTLELAWSIVCFFIYRPSKCFPIDIERNLIDTAIEKLKTNGPIYYTREKLISKYSKKYAAIQIPNDFKRARSESLLEIDGILIIGEYAEKSARLLLINSIKCKVFEHYNTIKGVRHIHSIHYSRHKEVLYISTGDEKKYLDEWKIYDENLVFSRRIRRILAGFTAATEVNSESYFGSDFSSRPNYIEKLNAKKYPFPNPAYLMFSNAFITLGDRYIVSLNSDLNPLKRNQCISIFDTKLERFIYCKKHECFFIEKENG